MQQISESNTELDTLRNPGVLTPALSIKDHLQSMFITRKDNLLTRCPHSDIDIECSEFK